ncbi:MAG: helix-turn-helix domain-containing protein [Flavobacteriaceae bacterium]
MKVIDFHIPKTTSANLIYQIDQAPFYPYYHRHQEIQISLFTQDTQYIISDQIGTFKAGEVLVLGSQFSHLFRLSDSDIIDKQPVMYTLFLPPLNSENQDKSLYQIKEHEFLKNLIKRSQQPFSVQLSAYRQRRWIKLFEQSGAKQYIKTLGFLEFISRRKTSTLHLFQDQHINEKEGARLNKIMQYMLERIDTEIDLDQIAAIAHLSPTSFCRFFKQHTDKTYLHFFQELKIQKVAQLLVENPDTPIGTIAVQMGYEDNSSFNRHFQKFKKTTPSRYRKKVLESK